MARPKADFPPSESIAALADAAGRLAVKVTPGAREEGIVLSDGKLMIKVRARPDGGAAIEAVLALLARALGVPRSRLTLLRGATSREKLVQIGG
jgi:uncharacterized protein YggU (UPF0235/DUF167 family)